MVNTKYNPISDELVGNYFQGLINKFYKILPMSEEKSPTLRQYIESLQWELTGNQEVICIIRNDGQYAQLIGTLESLNESAEIKYVKREVFKCIRIIEQLNNKYFGR